jgi:hypothetical protein
MLKIQAGDRIRIKERPDWPMPGGYNLAGLEGYVFDTIDYPEGYILVLLDKEDATGLDPRVPLGFRADAVEKL